MRFPEFFCLVSALALPLLLLGCEKPSVWSVQEESGGVCRTTERCVSSPNFPKIYGPNELCAFYVHESGILHISGSWFSIAPCDMTVRLRRSSAAAASTPTSPPAAAPSSSRLSRRA